MNTKASEMNVDISDETSFKRCVIEQIMHAGSYGSRTVLEESGTRLIIELHIVLLSPGPHSLRLQDSPYSTAPLCRKHRDAYLVNLEGIYDSYIGRELTKDMLRSALPEVVIHVTNPYPQAVENRVGETFIHWVKGSAQPSPTPYTEAWHKFLTENKDRLLEMGIADLRHTVGPAAK